MNGALVVVNPQCFCLSFIKIPRKLFVFIRRVLARKYPAKTDRSITAIAMKKSSVGINKNNKNDNRKKQMKKDERK